MICTAQPCKMTQRALHPLISVQTIGGNNKSIISTRRAIVKTNAITKQIRRCVSKITHTFRKCNIVSPQFNGRPFRKHMVMVHIHPCLNCGKRGVCIFCHREILVKDQPLLKKVMGMRHLFGKAAAQNIPWECIGKNI